MLLLEISIKSIVNFCIMYNTPETTHQKGGGVLVDYIKIMPDKNIVFHLRNGNEEIVPLAEVQ